MKKFITKLVLAAIILINASNVTAQNHCVLKNGKGTQTVITYPENTMTFQHNDHMATVVTKPTIAPKEKGNAPTHTLTINAPVGDDWEVVYVCDSLQIIEEFYQDMGDSFPVELVEGTYYVLSTGTRSSSDFAPCLWVREDIVLNEDVVIDVDYDECVFSLSIDAVDEHGNSFDGIDFETSFYVAVFDLLHRGFCTAAFYEDGTHFPSNPLIRYNGFNENSTLNSSVSLEPGYQKSYFLKCGQLNGLHEDHTFTITADDYSVTQELFPNANNCSYSLGYFTLYNNGAYLGVYPLIPSFIMEPSIPYTIVSNDRIVDPTNFEDGSKTYLQPSINEWSDEIYSFYGSCVTTFCFNADGEVVRGARPSFFQLWTASWPNPIPYTPAMSVKPNDKLTSFGERTPLATYSPMAFNANNSPYNITFIKGGLFFGGENSCERPCDYDCHIKACINGEEFYDDNLYKYNLQTFTSDPYPITIDINNNHLFANDVHKTNKTHVEFDLRNDDAIPPTTTFLRVLDGNGDESICLNDLSQSTLVFACADFTYSFTGNVHMEYNAKPEVEVYCAIEQDEWEPLVFEEDESLFDEDYGNVFTADLGQLESRALNKWVSLKFVLTDESGNTQMQELSNVFYSGESVSVNEQTALTHTVYPNPFTNEVRITAAQAVNGLSNVLVYNVLGEQVYNKAENCTETQDFTIDGSAWKPGVYFYSISTENGVLQGKIVKE